MHRVNRCTLAGTVWAPTSANRTPAHCHPLPGRPPYRAAARSTRPTIPRAPRPRIRPTARAPALRPLRLHRLRAAPGCPRPSMSPSSRSRIVVQVVAIGKSRAHRPCRAHRAPPPASRPPCADIRVTPPISLLALRRPQGPGWQEPRRMHPFFAECAKRPSSWQHPPEMHAFRDQDGNILALCIHSRVQSGDLGYMARESCRQGPFFASRNPKSRMARRCCQRRPAFLRQQPAVRRNGLCAMRQRHAARGMAERALRPAARAWPACRMRPPCHLACARRGLRPCHLARVHRRRLTRAALRRPRPATRSPYRCISPPAHRTHPASHADPPRPGNKRNNTSNSMRA